MDSLFPRYFCSNSSTAMMILMTNFTISVSHCRPSNSNSNTLPTRGTRLLNRSRVQNLLTDSPRSLEQIPRPRRSSSLNKPPSPLQAKGTASNGSATDDLTIDRSTRNAMIQDVLYFKKQLLRLRRLLQEVIVMKNCFSVDL